MLRRNPALAAILACLPAVPAPGGVPWINFNDETATRLVSDPAVGTQDVEEKDYAWDDIDHDGDTDLVVARKQTFTTAGGRPNVLFLNEVGVLTDRTADYVIGFLDLTNDRDIQLVDVNNDSWPDIVTAAACNGCNPAGIADDSRLYLNLGSPGGTWLGFGAPTILIQGGNNLNAVAAGDLTGDGYVDLYFVSANDSFEDQLLINDGPANPGVFTVDNDRLTAEMRQSNYGASAAIADMNGDGWNDILKVEFHRTEIFYNGGGGLFAVAETVSTASDVHVNVALLNGDSLPDMVVTNEATDSYLLNQGNGGDGLADFATFFFPSATNNFGGNSVVSDLDGDDWKDVIIASVDVDQPGCNGFADILRNNGNPPNVTFTFDLGNIPINMFQGIHDVAAFDIDGNGTKDLVVGRCTGTQVWMAAPVIAVEFGYPEGLPQFVPPDTPATFQVQFTPINSSIDPETPALHASVNGGQFAATQLEPLGGDLFLATLPAVACSDRIHFYVTAQITSGPTFIDPPGAPAVTYAAIAAAGTETLFSDHIEGDVSGWTVVSNPTLTSGEWEQAVPNATLFAGQVAAPGNDATPDPGLMAFVTGNGPPGGAAQVEDVDGGPTYLVSPAFDLQGSDAFITYARWAYSSTGVHDHLAIEISNDGGSSWTLVDTIENTGSSWQTTSFIVGSFVPPTSEVQVRFAVCDCPNDSITEAGIDDFRVDEITCTPPCPWDLDRSGAVGIIDFLALLAAWGGDPGGPPDFDGDGDVDITDFLALLANWGTCP